MSSQPDNATPIPPHPLLRRRGPRLRLPLCEFWAPDVRWLYGMPGAGARGAVLRSVYLQRPGLVRVCVSSSSRSDLLDAAGVFFGASSVFDVSPPTVAVVQLKRLALEAGHVAPRFFVWAVRS